ncbi:MAG: hypothetical protein CMK07_13155 [Ponticaulis sp.]|nr:hypothetical protein [Ponticaulis sp.]
MHTVRTLLSWLLAIFLIAVLLHSTVHPLPDPATGQVLLFDLPGQNVIFATLAERSGIALFEPTGRLIFSGVIIAAMFCLLIPYFRKFGAGLAAVLMGGLIAAHLSPWLGMELAVEMGSDQSDTGAQFYLTVAILTASLLLIAVHPGRDDRH